MTVGRERSGPFIEVNCAAIPDTMLEAELFGFEAGAFTDAKRAKPGLFEAASGGTLFLDEIDALPLVLQGKLLTAIESKRVRRLGAVTERAVDVKVIAATNAVLPEAMAAGRFRADLYHRLAVVVLVLPPLRERGEDILVLAEAFLQHYTAAHGVPPKRLSAEAAAWLQSYAWPGNVRELSHVMERVTLLHMGEEVDAETLMQLCQPLTAPAVRAMARASAPRSWQRERALPAEAERDSAGAGADRGQCGAGGAAAGGEPGYRALSHAALWDCAATPGAPSPADLLVRPGRASGFSSAQRDGLLRAGGSPHPSLAEGEETSTGCGSAARRRDAGAPIEHNVPTPEPAWEHKPVAVLALELTWPGAAGLESLRYDPWTERARWEQAIVDKVRGFGGALVQRTASAA